MTNLYSRPGIGNVGSYQASGDPWVTGSTVPNAASAAQEVAIGFPRVAKYVKVYSLTAQELRIHFVSLNAAPSESVYDNKHYITFTSGSVSEFTCRVKEIYVGASGSTGGDFEVFAELTHIPREEMYALTGSGHTS
jgi:hypothetical protein